MATMFVTIERETLILLPLDLRECVPENNMVRNLPERTGREPRHFRRLGSRRHGRPRCREEKSLMGKIVICGFDGNPANLKAIKAGEIDAIVKQDNDKMGKQAVDLIIKINKGEAVEKFYPIDGFIIDKTNVDKYM